MSGLLTRGTSPTLNGHTVIITGASSGIGEAAAHAVAARGAVTLLLARRADALNQVAANIRSRGHRAYVHQCDITDRDQVNAVVATMRQAHGPADMLVNNAGRSIRRSVYRSENRLHDYERTMAVNYLGAVSMVLALLPDMRERRFGHIVNVSSVGVQAAAPRFSAYLASKAALDKFSEVAATEFLADRITFTTIHMPLVDTPMIAPTRGRSGVTPTSSGWAAATIVRALVERPRRIDTPRGTLAEYGALLAPGIITQVMHAYFRAYPDSPAAEGFVDDESLTDVGVHTQTTDAFERTGVVNSVKRSVRRAGRLVPGTFW